MLIFETNSSLNEHLESIKETNSKIGFIPTMGALHRGHISLIELSKGQNLYTICSIFVNPTQFNDKNDLINYPRTPEDDIRKLEVAGCDLLYMPSTEEVYANYTTNNYNFGELEQILEGKHRPGHFNGVAQVVSRLFEIIQPQFAFFGAKDFQQLKIIEMLVKIEGLKIEIVSCPIIREPDGLAMSSRNTRLTVEERQIAKIIPETMGKLKDLRNKGLTVQEIKSFVTSEFSKKEHVTLEYFDICEVTNLAAVNTFSANKQTIALIACFVGKIRLLDNLYL